MSMRPLRRASRLLAALPILLFVVAAHAAALKFPPLSGRVVDAAHILPNDAVQRLDGLLAAHEKTTGEQVVVVTLPSLQDTTIEDYGVQLGRHWGIGQKGKNTGALLIVAPKERKVRIEVGYGLEGTLTDARSKIIIEEIILPWFRQGRMDQGIVAGTAAVVSVLEGRAVTADRAVRPAARQTSGVDWPWLIMVVLFGVFWLGARPMLAGYPPGYRRRGPWSRSGPWIIPGGGGFGGGGGGSGGGFGGGGGSFGGGGASGGW